MTQYNTLIVKLFNWQLSKSKSGIKNGTEVTLKLPSILIMRLIFGKNCY